MQGSIGICYLAVLLMIKDNKTLQILSIFFKIIISLHTLNFIPSEELIQMTQDQKASPL